MTVSIEDAGGALGLDQVEVEVVRHREDLLADNDGLDEEEDEEEGFENEDSPDADPDSEGSDPERSDPEVVSVDEPAPKDLEEEIDGGGGPQETTPESDPSTTLVEASGGENPEVESAQEPLREDNDPIVIADELDPTFSCHAAQP